MYSQFCSSSPTCPDLAAAVVLDVPFRNHRALATGCFSAGDAVAQACSRIISTRRQGSPLVELDRAMDGGRRRAAAPRLHRQWLPDEVRVESGFSRRCAVRAEGDGPPHRRADVGWTSANSILATPNGPPGAPDPRKGGAEAGGPGRSRRYQRGKGRARRLREGCPACVHWQEVGEVTAGTRHGSADPTRLNGARRVMKTPAFSPLLSRPERLPERRSFRACAAGLGRSTAGLPDLSAGDRQPPSRCGRSTPPRPTAPAR